MELDSSALFTAVGIDILYSIDVRDIFHNFNNSLQIISLQDIDDFLLEELRESGIAFLSELRIFVKVFLHLNR